MIDQARDSLGIPPTVAANLNGVIEYVLGSFFEVGVVNRAVKSGDDFVLFDHGGCKNSAAKTARSFDDHF